MQAALRAWACAAVRHRQLRAKFARVSARVQARRLQPVVRAWSAFASAGRRISRAAHEAGRLRLQRWWWGAWRAGARQERADKQRMRLAQAHFKSRR